MLTFTEFLTEGRAFDLGGKVYTSGFGRYTCDGKSISKEEYMKASEEFKSKNKTTSSKKTIEKEYDSGVKLTVSNKKPVEFYIETKDGFEKKKGKLLKISNLPDHEFVMTRNNDGGWVVSERSTGLALGLGTFASNLEDAVDEFYHSDAGKHFTSMDKEKFANMVNTALERQAKQNKPRKD